MWGAGPTSACSMLPTVRVARGLILLCASALMVPVYVHGITHGVHLVKIPSIAQIKQKMLKDGSLMRGSELDSYAQDKHDEMMKHVHATHAHESKYGQVAVHKSPLPTPKHPIPYDIKDLSKAHTLMIRRTFNRLDTDGDGAINRVESLAGMHRRRDSITPKLVEASIKRLESARTQQTKYMYVSRKNFDKSVEAVVKEQENIIVKAGERLKRFEERKPERSTWTEMEKRQYSDTLEFVDQVQKVLSLPDRLKELEEKGEGNSELAQEMRHNVTQRRRHLHPYEHYYVTEDSVERRQRIETYKAYHKDDVEAGEEIVELEEGKSLNSKEHEVHAERGRAQVQNVIDRHDEYFQLQDVNRDGKITFKEFYWRMKRLKMREHEAFKAEHESLLSSKRAHGHYTNGGFWVPASEEEDEEVQAEKKRQEQEREAILLQWEEEL